MQQTFETVAYIHIEDKKILLTMNKGKSAFYMPGGKREGDEDDTNALVRELKEELSINLDKNSLAKLGVFEAQAYGMPKGVNVRIICYTGNHRGKLIPGREIDKMAFFSHADYFSMSDTAPAVRLILNKLKLEGLIL